MQHIYSALLELLHSPEWIAAFALLIQAVILSNAVEDFASSRYND